MSGDCGNREERLVSLLYEDGDPADLAEIRAHLARCPACREEFESLTSTRGLLGAWPDPVHAPRGVQVEEPGRLAGRLPGDSGGKGRGRFGSFLPSLAAAATVVLALALSAPFLRFQVGGDGSLRVALGGSSVPGSEGPALVTREDLDQGLARTAEYLEALVRAAREQDRQAILAAVDQAVMDERASMGEQVIGAINSAFDEMDRRRRADLEVMLSSMNDLQVITGTELQRMNAVLASLTLTPQR
jgi:hypothetical protein